MRPVLATSIVTCKYLVMKSAVYQIDKTEVIEYFSEYKWKTP